MLSLLAGLILGLGLYHFVLTKHLRHLTHRIAHLRQHQLQRELRDLTNYPPVQSLLEEFSQIDVQQKETIVQLKRDNQHLRADLMNISHDLRTPLTAIYGYLQLLNDAQLTPRERTYYLTIATQRTEALETLIQNLFYLGKLEANTIEYQRAPLRIDMILKEQLISLYQNFEEAGIHVDLNVGDESLHISDKIAVERIFNNLLCNAIQHGNSPLTITHQLDENQQCYTRFSNTLQPEATPDIDQVFNRLYTGASHRNQSNSGLGLTICAELCHQLGHRIGARIVDNQFMIDIYW